MIIHIVLLTMRYFEMLGTSNATTQGYVPEHANPRQNPRGNI